MKNQKRQAGFTLIELMIVIAIIGILMAYAIPAYRDYTTRTLLNEGNAMAAGYKAAVSAAYAKNGTLAGLANNGNGIGDSIARGQCVESLTVVGTAADATITVEFDCAAGTRAQANPDVGNGQIIWTATPPATAGGTSLVWECRFNTPTAPYNPCPNA